MESLAAFAAQPSITCCYEQTLRAVLNAVLGMRSYLKQRWLQLQLVAEMHQREFRHNVAWRRGHLPRLRTVFWHP